jgi:RNA polymerase sigma factor (sigma-70 family)
MAGIGDALVREDRPGLRGRRSDAELIELITRDDRAAFAELYDRYASASFRLAHRITRDLQLAEVVVQEAFFAIWREADRFDGRRARPATWLLTITHHKAVDLVRGEQLRRTEPDEQIALLADDSIDLPHEVWLGAQRERVRSALAELPAPQREVIELAYFKGYSQHQLAQLLEQPLGTIKSRTHAALARLRASLEGEGASAELAC